MTPVGPLLPRDIPRALINRIASGDLIAALELYAEDIELSDEFALPSRVAISGKNQLAAAFEQAEKNHGLGQSPMYHDIEVQDLRVHEATDGETVIAEWTYVSRTDHGEVRNGNIIVLRIRDGLIESSRDYHNHVTRAQADGILPQLLIRIKTAAANNE